MNIKKKSLIIILLSSCLLISCGQKNNSKSEDVTVKQKTFLSETSQQENKLIEIDPFENVEYVDYYDENNIVNNIGTKISNKYPVMTCFTIDDNKYWKEYKEEDPGDYVWYEVESTEVTKEGVKIIVNFNGEDYKSYSNFLSDHNYKLKETSHEYFMPIEDYPADLINESMYTDNIRKVTDEIVNNNFSQNAGAAFEIQKRYLLVWKDERCDPVPGVAYITDEGAEAKSFVYKNATAEEMMLPTGSTGIYYIIKNMDTGEYAYAYIRCVVQNDKLISSDFGSHYFNKGFMFPTVEKTYDRIVDEYITCFGAFEEEKSDMKIIEVN